MGPFQSLMAWAEMPHSRAGLDRGFWSSTVRNQASVDARQLGRWTRRIFISGIAAPRHRAVAVSDPQHAACRC
jgi:hypothetical protein